MIVKPTEVSTSQSKRVWSPALLDAFGGEVMETYLPGDEIAPSFEEDTGVRYYATNKGWSGNIYKSR